MKLLLKIPFCKGKKNVNENKKEKDYKHIMNKTLLFLFLRKMTPNLQNNCLQFLTVHHQWETISLY
jgi:hypothetical protein